jgi:hypothetical protein
VMLAVFIDVDEDGETLVPDPLDVHVRLSK